MLKAITNISKQLIGNIPTLKQRVLFEKLTWVNEKVLKHQEDKKIKTILLSGCTLYYRRPYELLHTYKELFERQIYKFQATINEPVIIDCGANIGLSVLYFKKLYPSAKLIAFEPDEDNFDVLTKNVSANNLSQVQLHKAAIWTHNDRISFSATGSEASRILEEQNATLNSAQAFRLADLLGKYNKIDFLKIDIEGAESVVLEDCKNLLSSVQNLFLEYHGKTSETEKLNDILNIIKLAGFDTYIQNASDNLLHPFLDKTANGIYDVQLNIFCYRNK